MRTPPRDQDTDEIRARERALDLREQELSSLDRLVDSRVEAVTRRLGVTRELEDYVAERTRTMRARIERLGVDVELPDFATSVEAAQTLTSSVPGWDERLEVVTAREALCARRAASAEDRRLWADELDAVVAAREAELLEREQALAGLLRRAMGAAADSRFTPPHGVPAAVESGASRRQHRRIGIKAHLAYGSAHEFLYAGEMENLSLGGLFVATDNVLPVGREVDLSLTFPDTAPLTLHAVVVWRREADGRGQPAGLGVRFVDLDPATEEAIEWHLSRAEAVADGR